MRGYRRWVSFGLVAVLATALAVTLSGCGIVDTLFGQPKRYELTNVAEGFHLRVTAQDTTMFNAAVVLNGQNLKLVQRSQNANCYTSLNADVLYCKFGDLTPYSNASIIFSGELAKGRLGWLDPGATQASSVQIYP